MKQVAKGSMLFAQAGLGGGVKALGPSPWAVEVWYDSLVADGGPAPESEPGMSLHIAAGEVQQLDMAFLVMWLKFQLVCWLIVVLTDA